MMLPRPSVMAHNRKRGDFKKAARRTSTRRQSRLMLRAKREEWTPLDLLEPDPDDLCDDCGMPQEDCECCPSGEHNPGDPDCDCDFSEPGDRGRIVE